MLLLFRTSLALAVLPHQKTMDSVRARLNAWRCGAAAGVVRPGTALTGYVVVWLALVEQSMPGPCAASRERETSAAELL